MVLKLQKNREKSYLKDLSHARFVRIITQKDKEGLDVIDAAQQWQRRFRTKKIFRNYIEKKCLK